MAFDLTKDFLDQSKICGLDEAGRGPLAGPVSAACVVLNPDLPIEGLADSKKLSANKREQLFELISAKALAWGHAFVWPDQIELLNIHFASLLAMQMAFAQAKVSFPDAIAKVQTALVDGKFCPKLEQEGFLGRVTPIVHGDSLIQCISAASILAKVFRDRYMCAYAKKDSRYGFEKHMGYATAAHKAAIGINGPCPIHRLSWLEPPDHVSSE